MNDANGLHYRDEILRHFADGTPWSATARAHYAECLECIAAVTAMLARQAGATAGTVESSQGQVSVTTPASSLPEGAQRALEHGRQVLAREFGIQAGSSAESR